jgi:hypothetical protein
VRAADQHTEKNGSAMGANTISESRLDKQLPCTGCIVAQVPGSLIRVKVIQILHDGPDLHPDFGQEVHAAYCELKNPREARTTLGQRNETRLLRLEQ